MKSIAFALGITQIVQSINRFIFGFTTDVFFFECCCSNKFEIIRYLIGDLAFIKKHVYLYKFELSDQKSEKSSIKKMYLKNLKFRWQFCSHNFCFDITSRKQISLSPLILTIVLRIKTIVSNSITQVGVLVIDKQFILN